MKRSEKLRDRFLGCLLGMAIGDALGMPAEGMSREQIRQKFGILEDFHPARGLPAGSYTDDTQMSLIIAQSLVEHRRFCPEDIAGRFARWRDYAVGPGRACWEAATRLACGVPWREAGIPSAGCGSAMRVAPLGLFHYCRRGELKKDAVTSSVITHTDSRACAGAAAVAFAVSYCLTAAESGFSQEYFIRETAEFVEDLNYKMAERIKMILPLLSLEEEEGLARLGTGGFVLETVPAAFYCFLKHIHSFRDALVAAVNAGGDTDSIGAICGAIAGAYHGAGKIPLVWKDRVQDRDKILETADALYNLVPAAGN
ncbi:ADP-ribosylglycohydrolase family protein [Calderihabitans maritimus]|uniref:ADP-ribosylglycohydrolase n=1 Tax=Calderihabitans maritimus TaxID=1246530 RepID=A0A1Z5HNC4_9FIRM|nr:ADP-ribosylglycohydrolase family protein [Calderihabitans maritimus]GAW91014.1 ADP-ribosylglycohydrolase [Calderihabitans maritimus]